MTATQQSMAVHFSEIILGFSGWRAYPDYLGPEVNPAQLRKINYLTHDNDSK
jgi:hypothetical protein